MDTSGAHAIDTIDDLRRHLQWAIELEHATIPPYLCALYSLDPARNPEAAQVVGTVLAEEMIHLALAANLLNAVGGAPKLDTPEALVQWLARVLPPGANRVAQGGIGGAAQGCSTVSRRAISVNAASR
jgi:hypothetical protein